MKKNLLLILAFYAIQFVVTTHVFAQKWAEDMFEERRHSFGSVAIGVEAVHRFKFKNPYLEDIHIVAVTSSCGCTTPSWPKNAIKKGETGEIVAKLNTDGQHKGDKSATLTVVIQAKNGNQPIRAEVQLQVTSYIRPDVIIKPGVVEFGSIREGKSVVKKLTLQYAGKPNWELIKIERENPHINVQADEVGRQNGRVLYSITVTILDTMPSGYVHDMVRFITNDTNSNASVVTLPVHGYVTTPLVAKPSPLVIGFVQPGETVKKNIVLRSDVAFKITRITSKDPRFQFVLANKENTTHVLPITFAADATLGELTEPIIIQTTLSGQQQLQLVTQGMVYDEQRLAERSKQRRQADELSPDTESPRVAEIADNTARMQIRLSSKEQASSNETAKKPNDDVPADRRENIALRSETLAPPQINLSEEDDVTDPQQEEILTAEKLTPVPRLMPNASTANPDGSDTATPSPMAVRREPEKITLQQVPANEPPVIDWDEVVSQDTSGEPSDENASKEVQSRISPVPSLQQEDTSLSEISDFVVIDAAAPHQQQTPSLRNTPETDDRHADVLSRLIPPERSSVEISQLQGLSFSKPSVKDNLAAFTESKATPVAVSEMFELVGEPKNTTDDDGKSASLDTPPQEAATRVARAVPIAEPPKVPPVPGMKPATQPSAVPPLPVPVVSPQKQEPQEVKPRVAEKLPENLPSDMAANSQEEIDSGLLDTLLRKTIQADVDTSNEKIAQVTPREPMPDDNGSEQSGDLTPMELQPLEPENLVALNGQLVTIPSKAGEDLELEDVEFFDDDPDFHLPRELMPPIDVNSRMNAATPSRERLPSPGDLPRMGTPPGQPQRNNSPAVIANGTPIPTGTPPRQTAQLPSANMQQRVMPQQPAPNPLTQQQIQQQALMQQRAMQQQQAQQRQAAGQPVQPQSTRIAQAPQASRQLAVPPAPVVPNTPMMAPAPNFR
ncbi:MAG: DUF1573 domain-containing protein [Planctomycetaceae bacterium]|nr:DUF1573 domain-containing protein [Planctomycetaceae bacterium]